MLDRGREQFTLGHWAEAFGCLAQADRGGRLAGADLELLARSAYMVGRDDDYVRALERAHRFYVDKPDVPTVWKGQGCRGCRNTGYRGRTGIHELMVNNDRLKDMVVQRVNAGVLRNDAIKNGGMRTLRQDGWKKVQLGITTIDEVARTTAGDIITVVEQTVTGGIEA